ncbi:MAG: hypothetical protein KAI83_05655 [Thiomargarita sp.]|nr:hypothetical protein [Thiomargarita sp.]
MISRRKFFERKNVTTQGNHKGLPLHQKIFVSLHRIAPISEDFRQSS